MNITLINKIFFTFLCLVILSACSSTKSIYNKIKPTKYEVPIIENLVDQKIINPKSPYSPSVIKHNKYLEAQLKDDDIISFLNSDKSKYRVLPIGELSDNRLVAFNIESVAGYHPAKLASYELLDKNVGMNYNILKMMNVKYLLSTQKFPEDQASDLSLKRVIIGFK